MGINWDIFRYMVSDVLVDVFLYIYILYVCIIHVTSHMLDLVISHLHVSGFDRNVFQRTSPICMVIQMAERRKPKMLPLQARHYVPGQKRTCSLSVNFQPIKHVRLCLNKFPNLTYIISRTKVLAKAARIVSEVLTQEIHQFTRAAFRGKQIKGVQVDNN